MFTVGRDGLVSGSFEGAVATQELQDAIAEIAAP